MYNLYHIQRYIIHLLHPFLDLASETFGYCKAKSADKLRFILGVHKFCPLPAMSGDVGWLGCKERCFIFMINGID